MRLTFLILIFSIIEANSFAQKDTVFLEVLTSKNYLIAAENEFLYNQAYNSQLNPYKDTLYASKDSTLFNGIIKLSRTWVVSIHQTFKRDWSYFVEDGKTTLVVSLLNDLLADSIFVTNDHECFISFNQNETISKIKNYKNNLMHGYQFEMVFDSIKFETLYTNDSLLNVLNEDIIYVGSKAKVLLEYNFIDTINFGNGKFANWELSVLPTKLSDLFPEYKIIMYQTSIPKVFNPSRKRDLRKIRKQMLIVKP